MTDEYHEQLEEWTIVVCKEMLDYAAVVESNSLFLLRGVSSSTFEVVKQLGDKQQVPSACLTNNNKENLQKRKKERRQKLQLISLSTSKALSGSSLIFLLVTSCPFLCNNDGASTFLGNYLPARRMPTCVYNRQDKINIILNPGHFSSKAYK